MKNKSSGLETPVLLVLGIVQGRRFPRRVSHSLLVEARFDGEILVTDPVDHAATPDFSTELAWELTRKTLHEHRLRRTPIKLQVFALDAETSKKELTGYCLLDLRSAQQDPTKTVWRPLLSTKYRQLKPELKCTLSIEEDQTPLKAEPEVKVVEPPPPIPLSAELNEENGYYQIGPASNDCRVFTWSITVVAANNLSQLVPSNTELRSEEGCYFSYSFLGNAVTTEKFYEFLTPDFPAERATARICATPENLHTYIMERLKMEFLLCCSDKVLGAATVVLRPLLTDKMLADPSITEPASLEGVFALRSPTSNKPLDAERTEETAVVRVSIVLRNEVEFHRDEIAKLPASGQSPVIAEGGTNQYRRTEDAAARKSENQRKPSPSEKLNLSPVSPEEDGMELKEQRTTDEQLIVDKPNAGNRLHNKLNVEKDAQTLTNPSNGNTDELIVDNQKVQDMRDHHNDRHQARKERIRNGPSMNPDTDANRHFTVSIDIRSISELDVGNTVNVVCRYLYPFFGSSSPVMTNPPVSVQRQLEALLPQSFCAFEFAATGKLLQHTFTSVPLLIEVWHRDISQRDQLLGISQVQLSKLLTQTTMANSNQRVFNEKVVIVSPESPARAVGKLHVVVGMEDHGPVKKKSTALHVAQNAITVDSTTSSTITRDDPKEGRTNGQLELQLEIWRNEQEQNFQTEMSAKESTHMMSLAREWKKRDMEREMLFKRKLDEYTELESKLKLSVTELRKRESWVAERETEVRNLRSNAEEEQHRGARELAEKSARMTDEFEHRAMLERNKCDEVEQRLKSVTEEIESVEARIRRQEADMVALRQARETNPEAKLREAIQLAQLEKDDLTRKLEAVTRSKAHYKQQWGSALHELAKIKQLEQDEARLNLERQQEELAEMKLRFLAAEEKKLVKSEMNELKTVKQELTNLVATESVAPPAEKERKFESDSSSNVLVENSNVVRLIEERDTLLRTGVYSLSDDVIAELDRQIREACVVK